MLQNFSRHVATTFLIFSLGTAYPEVGSSSRESANPIAFCVAEFRLVLSSQIRKRQNFLAISSWCVPMGWNLLYSHSRACISSASSCVRKSFIVAGCWPAVWTTNLDSLSVARTQRFWISIKHCWIPRNKASGPPLLFVSSSKYSVRKNLENSSCILDTP